MKYGIKDICWYDTDTNKFHGSEEPSNPRDFYVIRVAVRVLLSEFLGNPETQVTALSIDKCNRIVQDYKLAPGKYNFEKWQ